MSVHIDAKREDIASVVLMPGDPLRAKYIADNYLVNVKQVNSLRNMLGYTGEYKNHPVTIMASGMGMPSMGIYAYELYNDYDVQTIIRIGSCGGYLENIKLRDIILVEKAITDSNFVYQQSGKKVQVINGHQEINQVIEQTAKTNNITYLKGNIYCTDVFYSTMNIKKDHCLGVEMESFALFYMANLLNKKAACLLSVSDNVFTQETLSGKEREETLTEMMELALDAITSL